METAPLARFGRTIRRLRTARGWSQERLAERADLHWTYVSGVERGKRNLGLRNIVRLARALAVPPARLMEGLR